MATLSPKVGQPRNASSTLKGLRIQHDAITASALPDKPSDTSSAEVQADAKAPKPKQTIWQTTYNIVTYTPKRCRYDPNVPFKFSLSLNLLFAFAACFTVANLYYTHPILNILAHDFNVSYEESSTIPTVAQAGYATGLLFICPLGDIFRRRAFTVILVFVTACLWIGLCLTSSFRVFSALSFLTAVTTVTPQIMLPLVGGLAPAHRRATALSVVVSGLLLGILIARVLSGVVTEYTSWRNVYWLALGLQYVILILLWLFMPDYPSANPDGLNYFKMLWSIVSLVVREPLLLQACLIAFFTSSIFTSYWTTVTFLLAGEPYNYSSLVIGLFAFIGIASMSLGPVYSRYVIDKFVPLFSVVLGELMNLTGVIIGTYTGTFTVAGPVIQALLVDLGMSATQIANRTAIYGIQANARNRINTAFMVSVFCGQLMGTAAGNHLYAQGGWIRSGSASVGFIGAALFFCALRGPWEKGYIGWSGGLALRKGEQRGLDDEEKGGERPGGEGEGEREVQQQEESVLSEEKNGQASLTGESGDSPPSEVQDIEKDLERSLNKGTSRTPPPKD